LKLFELLVKAVIFAVIRVAWMLKPGLATPLYCWYLRRRGVKIEGRPNYISAKVWFDSTDYSLISLGDGCTISSNVRILTHDAAAGTVGAEVGAAAELLAVRIRPVAIGRNCFIGTGSLLLPGAQVGAGSIVAAGSVVRGVVPPLSIVIGSPARISGSVPAYLKKYRERS
jgi:acetyltransferase-like isoleucine patch superfamily enzyme